MPTPIYLAALIALVLAGTAHAYTPQGEYLDFADRHGLVVAGDNVRFDETGLPEVRYGTEWHSNAVTTAQFGLQQWSWWKRTSDPTHLANARLAADWLVANQDPETGGWLYRFDYTVAGTDETLRAPWLSAMAQGEAMSLLTRLHGHTGDQIYLDAAVAALEPLTLAVEQGGVTARWEGLPFFEEYPTSRPTYTLNGFIFCLFGLYDLGQHNPQAAELFDAGASTVERMLPLYERSGFSTYHLGHLFGHTGGVVMSTHYHWIHVMQLDELYSIRPVLAFKQWHDRWAAWGRPAPKPAVSAAVPLPAIPSAAVPLPAIPSAAAPSALPSVKIRRPCGRKLARWRATHSRKVLRRYQRCMRTNGWAKVGGRWVSRRA
jgi:heparosan-N-sulfate-glucuronate 5-epimerase